MIFITNEKILKVLPIVVIVGSMVALVAAEALLQYFGL